MFTGIIENVGEIVSIEKQNDNITFGIECDISKELKLIKAFLIMAYA